MTAAARARLAVARRPSGAVPDAVSSGRTLAANAPAALPVSHGGRTELTQEELVVIGIGRIDARSPWWRGSLQPAGWRRRLFAVMRWTFGVTGVQSLADERLETLRLLVCMVVRGNRDAADCAVRLADLGMPSDAIAHAIRRASAPEVA